MRLKTLAVMLTVLIAVSIVSYGTAIGSGSRIFTPAATSPFGSPAAASGFGMVQAIEVIGSRNTDRNSDLAAQAATERTNGNENGQCGGNTAVAIAESQISGTMKCTGPAWLVTLRIDDGSLQSYVQRTPLNLRIGDRVLVATDAIER